MPTNDRNAYPRRLLSSFVGATQRAGVTIHAIGRPAIVGCCRGTRNGVWSYYVPSWVPCLLVTSFVSCSTSRALECCTVCSDNVTISSSAPAQLAGNAASAARMASVISELFSILTTMASRCRRLHRFCAVHVLQSHTVSCISARDVDVAHFFRR